MKANKDGSNKNQHINDEMTALYVEALSKGELPDITEDNLHHVEICQHCKDRILELSFFIRNPDSQKPAVAGFETLKEKSSNRHTRIMPLAALFILGALVIGAYYLFFRGPGMTVLPVTSKKPSKQVISASRENSPSKNSDLEFGDDNSRKKLVDQAGNKIFRINPNLESMVNSHYRSEAIEITSPRNNSTLTIPITFSWREVQQKSLTLKIINNLNQLFYQFQIEKDQFVFQEKLPPGLYYWKLENKNDLLYIGKFVIR